MDIRWMAVVTGFVVDYMVTTIFLLMFNPDQAFFDAPDLHRLDHIALITLALLATGVGGFVAARMVRGRYWLHGLLVGVLGILVGQLEIMGGAAAPPRFFVIASAVGCAIGALGGLIGGMLAPVARRSGR
jgi:putative membrane protein (TIGR04086 family)